MWQCSHRTFLNCELGACSAGTLIGTLSAQNRLMPSVWLIGLTTPASLLCLRLSVLGGALARIRGRIHLSARTSAKESVNA